jgi:hypothetical protein
MSSLKYEAGSLKRSAGGKSKLILKRLTSTRLSFWHLFALLDCISMNMIKKSIKQKLFMVKTGFSYV